MDLIMSPASMRPRMRHRSSPRWLAAAITVLTLASAAPAMAQNASLPNTLELYSTLRSIGVRLAYTGDDDNDAVAWIEWREAGAVSWTRGVDLTRITNRRWAGSVLWLEPAASYEVRSVIVDPDGGGSLSGVSETRTEPAVTPAGTIIWVAPNGDDGNAGSYAYPLATIQAAVNRAAPGTEIRVQPGIYYESVSMPASGTADAMIRLTAHAPGAILDGSDPAFLHRNDWRDDGDGVFSIPFAQPARLICADSTQRLYHHAGVAALRAHAFGISQGWTVENSRLSVLLEDGSSPAGHTMHIARYNWGIYVEADYCWIDGLEIRYFGNVSSTASAIALWDARGCVLTGNYAHSIGGRPIFLRTNTRETLVQGNTCVDPRIGGWPWDAVKGHEEEITGISNRGDRGNVIRDNRVVGTFNGIDGRPVDADENGGADCDIHDNVLEKIGDDAIEIDEVSGINVRIFGNRMLDVFNGLSLAPIYQGPVYFLRNTIGDYWRSGCKFSGESTGEAWICHNTMSTQTSGKAAVHPCGHYFNLHFRNNILTGNGRESVSDDGGESQTGNDFDFDLLHAGAYPAVFRWKGVSYANIAALRAATGFEQGGREGAPLFRAPAERDYTLLAGSPAIDGALRMPGINDRFAGTAPDVGACEFDPDVSSAGEQEGLGPGTGGGEDVLATRGAERVRVAPNPARGAVQIGFSLARGGSVQTAIFDTSGRLVRELFAGLLGAGRHQLIWDGRDGDGREVPAGVYHLRMRCGARATDERVVRLR